MRSTSGNRWVPVQSPLDDLLVNVGATLHLSAARNLHSSPCPGSGVRMFLGTRLSGLRKPCFVSEYAVSHQPLLSTHTQNEERRLTLQHVISDLRAASNLVWP